jgi:hypothetical protein
MLLLLVLGLLHIGVDRDRDLVGCVAVEERVLDVDVVERQVVARRLVLRAVLLRDRAHDDRLLRH